MKVYNNTIVDWGEDAAITIAHHPHLTALFFIRVNLSDGELPQGLLSPNFPVTINDIEFCVTNLRSLPSDLGTKWPQNTMLYLENNASMSIPEVMLHMNLVHLSFDGNPIQEIPNNLFEVDSIVYVYVGNTLTSVFPANVTSFFSPLAFVYLYNTQVAYFPTWVDELIARWSEEGAYPILASGTPYCSELLDILNGSRVKLTF